MGDSDKIGFRQMMPGLFSGVATALTAAAGLIGVLHETGYLGNRAALRPGLARAHAQVRMLDEPQLAAADSPTAPGLPANNVVDGAVSAAGPMRHKSLSGGWRDGASNCHQIKQTGHELTVTSYFANNGLWAVGSGTVKGRAVSVRLNATNPASPEADMILSETGHELSGMIKGPKGAHVAMWRFVGPSCLQTAARPE